MKKPSFLLLLALAGSQAQAQAPKIIDQHIPLAAGASIKLNIQIADSIRVIVWDKNEAYVQGSVDVNNNKNNDLYQVTTSGAGTNAMEVKTEFVNSKGWKCCNCDTTSIAFTVYVPEGANLNIETINGNIIITGRTGAVRAHSISGFVDLAVNPAQKADLEMKTISGSLYSDLDLQLQDKQLSQVGGNIHTALNGGGDKHIDLETISGDIFFRKAKEG